MYYLIYLSSAVKLMDNDELSHFCNNPVKRIICSE